MKPSRSISSMLLVGAGLSALLIGALLAQRSAYGSREYIAGLGLHLLGLAGCIRAINRLATRPTVPVAAIGDLDSSSWETLRETRFRGRVQVIRAALGLIALVSICSGLWWLERELSELALLHRDGQTCQAQIINKEPVSQLGPAAAGMVYYSFRMQGRPVVGRFRAPRADYALLRTGRRLTVTCLPTAPRIHRLGVVDSQRVAQDSIAGLLLVTCVLAYLTGPIFAIERMLRRELHLARYGVLVTGTITGSKRIYRAGRQVGCNVRYQLTLPGTGPISGRARIGQAEGEPTLIGFPITVMVDPAQPQRHRPTAAFHAVEFGRRPGQRPTV